LSLSEGKRLLVLGVRRCAISVQVRVACLWVIQTVAFCYAFVQFALSRPSAT
jgi:hypothetical protein